MKLYLIRTQDIFTATAKGQLNDEVHYCRIGTLWAEVFLTPEQRQTYTYPICEI